MGLAISNKLLDKYLSFLTRLDNSTKKKLIVKLKESIQPKKNNQFDLKDLFGAWEDTRDSDEIIRAIRDSRVDQKDIPDF